ncbi:MAG: heavy-metal-associated domain-containing protein [Acidimicrobiales bacterium]
MATTRISVEGMTCQNCVRHVKEAIAEVAGVGSVEVDLDSASATVASDAELDLAAVRHAVEEAGYSVHG